MNGHKIIYSINIKDVQGVALEKEGRKLTESELNKVSDKIGDYIDWQQVIEHAISDCFYD